MSDLRTDSYQIFVDGQYSHTDFRVVGTCFEAKDLMVYNPLKGVWYRWQPPYWVAIPLDHVPKTLLLQSILVT